MLVLNEGLWFLEVAEGCVESLWTPAGYPSSMVCLISSWWVWSNSSLLVVEFGSWARCFYSTRTVAAQKIEELSLRALDSCRAWPEGGKWEPSEGAQSACGRTRWNFGLRSLLGRVASLAGWQHLLAGDFECMLRLLPQLEMLNDAFGAANSCMDQMLKRSTRFCAKLGWAAAVRRRLWWETLYSRAPRASWQCSTSLALMTRKESTMSWTCSWTLWDKAVRACLWNVSLKTRNLQGQRWAVIWRWISFAWRCTSLTHESQQRAQRATFCRTSSVADAVSLIRTSPQKKLSGRGSLIVRQMPVHSVDASCADPFVS